MNTWISCVFILGALFLSTVAPAVGAGMKDGLWEITTNTEMPGMPYQPAPSTMTHCYTKEDLKDDKQIVPKQDGNCKVTDMKHTGSKMTWKMSCTGDNKSKGEGEIVYKGDTAYDGFMKFEMEGMKITSRYKAKRVGACK